VFPLSTPLPPNPPPKETPVSVVIRAGGYSSYTHCGCSVRNG
jgi:hypothetical protein